MHDELTEVDIKKMKEEIEYRTLVLKPRLIETLQTARALGDLSENNEYRSAKRDLNRNYSRINYLNRMINTAVVIKVKDTDDQTVGLFDRVTLWYEEDDEEGELTIVTTLRNDALNGFVSKESPVGRALLGRKLGDRVMVKVNDTYSYPVVIRKIHKGEDDESLDIMSY